MARPGGKDVDQVNRSHLSGGLFQFLEAQPWTALLNDRSHLLNLLGRASGILPHIGARIDAATALPLKPAACKSNNDLAIPNVEYICLIFNSIRSPIDPM